MNTLLSILLSLAASAGIAAWQQQSINRIEASIARLSSAIQETRSGLESGQAFLAASKNRLEGLQAALRRAPQKRSISSSDVKAGIATPEAEGWWPQDRPYFYLPKSLLPLVRFRDHELTGDELTPEIKASLAEEHVSSTAVFNELFTNGELNPHMAELLGMTSQETDRVNEIYSDLRQQVRSLEAARIQPLDPPEVTDDGRNIIARLPALGDEVRSELGKCHASLSGVLGENRAKILEAHAEDYFNENLDGLGEKCTRDFIYKDQNLSVRFSDSSGHPFYSRFSHYCGNLAPGQNWRYSYLLGPGAPVEIK